METDIAIATRRKEDRSHRSGYTTGVFLDPGKTAVVYVNDVAIATVDGDTGKVTYILQDKD